jgi:hypothetical protein
LIPSVDLGARVSIIIYLLSWSESMALASLIWWISPGFLQKLGFSSSSEIKRESLDLGKNLFRNIVPFVEVTLVSKFHEISWAITRDQLLGDLSLC